MPVLAESVELSQGGGLNPFGLVARARPLPDGWENGVEFLAVGCREPQVVNVCEAIADDPDASVRPLGFEPVIIRQSAACSTLSTIDLNARAQDRLASTSDYALGQVLATGAGTVDNPSLADATHVHTSSATDPVDAALEAMSCLEGAIADVGFGGRAYLHAHPKAAAYLRKADAISADGVSPAGHQWIINPGYQTATDTVTVWATGTVWAAVGEVEVLDNDGWRYNTHQPFRQRAGLVAFDDCINLSASFPVPECTP